MHILVCICSDVRQFQEIIDMIQMCYHTDHCARWPCFVNTRVFICYKTEKGTLTLLSFIRVTLRVLALLGQVTWTETVLIMGGLWGGDARTGTISQNPGGGGVAGGWRIQGPGLAALPCPGNTPENLPPTEACMINSKKKSLVYQQGLQGADFRTLGLGLGLGLPLVENSQRTEHGAPPKGQQVEGPGWMVAFCCLMRMECARASQAFSPGTGFVDTSVGKFIACIHDNSFKRALRGWET